MPPKRARERKRQSKLTFSPATKSSPVAKPSSSVVMGQSPSKATKAAPTTQKPRTRTASKNAHIYPSSEDELQVETERGMRLGLPVRRPHGMFDSSEVDLASSQSSEEEEEDQVKAKPATHKRRRVKESSESKDEAAVTIIPKKRQRRFEVEDESSEENEELRLPSKRRNARPRGTPDEEVDERTPPRSTRRRAARRRSTSEEEVEEPTPPRSNRRRATRRPSSSDEEVEEPTPPRSNRRRAIRATSAPDEEDLEEGSGSGDDGIGAERDELKQDLAFLRSSPLPDRGRLRSTQEKPKTEKQKALEALKKRRAGTSDPSSSATPGRKKHFVVDSESESELEVIKEEPDSDIEILDDEENEGDEDRDANALDMFQEDENDEGFIDDNADDIIGEPSASADLDELRLLHNLSRAKSKDLFKHAIEWMVMKKIHPGFDSKRNIYTIAFRRLNDEVKALAGSKYTSSAWTSDFTKAINARPDLIIDDISSAMRAVTSPHCEACNRTNHPATFELMLTGRPYHPETLEPLDTDSDSDSDSDSPSDSPISSADPASNPRPRASAWGLPPETHAFPLGSTCKANAHVLHTLNHWRYHLFEHVKEHLAREGHLRAEKLVERDAWSDSKRMKAAHRIVDDMDAAGEVRRLYRLYKEQVDFALEARNDYTRGWGRRR